MLRPVTRRERVRDRPGRVRPGLCPVCEWSGSRSQRGLKLRPPSERARIRFPNEKGSHLDALKAEVEHLDVVTVMSTDPGRAKSRNFPLARVVP